MIGENRLDMSAEHVAGKESLSVAFPGGILLRSH